MNIKDSQRFEEIINEINELVWEAYSMLPDSQRLNALSGWHSEIRCALSDENNHLGTSKYNMTRTLKNED